MTDDEVRGGEALAPTEEPAGFGETVRRYRIDDGEALSDAILGALPLETDGVQERPPLYSTVDVERLESLFGSRFDSHCEVSFTYEEFDVTVTAREVVVRRSEPAVDS